MAYYTVLYAGGRLAGRRKSGRRQDGIFTGSEDLIYDSAHYLIAQQQVLCVLSRAGFFQKNGPGNALTPEGVRLGTQKER